MWSTRWRPMSVLASSAVSNEVPVAWRALRAEIVRALADAGVNSPETEARFIVESASGYEATEWLEIADAAPTPRAEHAAREMSRRRVTGEPLQYVLGGWGFRDLDLFVDPRVLIPRPETEYLVEVALEEAARAGLRRARSRATVGGPVKAVVADIGTGSGAIAISLAAELPDVEVWATDVSDDALAVARANVAGSAATRVRIAEAGEWFDPLPPALRGALRLIVSNPPYVAEHEFGDLPREVSGYEPRRALVSGPSGTESIETLLELAPGWLARGGSFVCEIAPHQAATMGARARELGYRDVAVRDDLTGRPRVLVARAD